VKKAITPPKVIPVYDLKWKDLGHWGKMGNLVEIESYGGSRASPKEAVQITVLPGKEGHFRTLLTST